MPETNASNETISHLNNALVEASRPTMYQTLKYWGKKPVNIWREFIEHYCPDEGVVLDPFAGSDIVAFESLALGRRSISFDLNPMSAFYIESLTTSGDIEDIAAAARQIIDYAKASEVYQKNYMVNDDILRDGMTALPEEYKNKLASDGQIRFEIYNYFWQNNRVLKVRTKTAGPQPEKMPAIDGNILLDSSFSDMDAIDIPYWYPTDAFPQNPSISALFITGVGGNDFSYLWTKRNLYLLSLIFNEILSFDDSIRLPLLAAFVHTLHLTSKMVYPRGSASNRDYSGSWGRADYMIRAKQLEQNPVIVFERGVFDKDGILKAIEDRRERVPVDFTRKANCVSLRPRNSLRASAALNYGSIDVADLCDLIPAKSVDFVLTDPPYGGLVQYMDLSMVWLVWLQHADSRYKPNSAGEITVKQGVVPRSTYFNRLVRAFKNLHMVLKDDGYMVLTFHHKNIGEWNDLLKALRQAGFIVDKVTHQYNKRSGEANVSNPYGTSGSDFYIRLCKHRDIDFTDERQSLEQFVIQKTIDIIAERCEPTQFEFITNGLLPEMIQAGYLQFDEPAQEVEAILRPLTLGNDPVFVVQQDNDGRAGDLWWFAEPSRYIRYMDMPLHSRVEEVVLALLRREVSVRLDDVLAEIFKRFPNGLTPDVRNITSVLEKYSTKANGKWKLNESVTADITRHSLAIENIATIGRRSGFKFHIGVREQHELGSSGELLSALSGFSEIPYTQFGIDEPQRQNRINQIDAVFFDEREIRFVAEVENSTDFAGAINRCSNLSELVPKIMIIPSNRLGEFGRVAADPQFRTSFESQNWHVIEMDDVNRLARSRGSQFDALLSSTWSLEEF